MRHRAGLLAVAALAAVAGCSGDDDVAGPPSGPATSAPAGPAASPATTVPATTVGASAPLGSTGATGPAPATGSATSAPAPSTSAAAPSSEGTAPPTADEPTTTADAPTTTADGNLPDVPTATVTVTGPAGARTLSVLVAATPAQRQQGLMQVTGLAPFDGMLFVFPADTTGGFWMKNTVIALSIAWFDGDGGFVSAAEMVPCPPEVTDCPVYRPAGAYRYALEVEVGGLAAFGIGPGSRLVP